MGDPRDVTIRLAGPADAPALAQLRYDFRAGQHPASEPEADFLPRCANWMAARLVPGSRWRCWVAEERDQLLGTLWLQFIEKIPNPGAEAETHAYISNVYIQPARRLYERHGFAVRDDVFERRLQLR